MFENFSPVSKNALSISLWILSILFHLFLWIVGFYSNFLPPTISLYLIALAVVEIRSNNGYDKSALHPFIMWSLRGFFAICALVVVMEIVYFIIN